MFNIINQVNFDENHYKAGGYKLLTMLYRKISSILLNFINQANNKWTK